MSSEGYHEPLDSLSKSTRDLHRAIVSLQEELEAVDWYAQRADACEDGNLREILLHNMREEMEHASMLVEWLRRNREDFGKQLKTYLFTEAPITEIEEEEGIQAEELELHQSKAVVETSQATPRRTIGSLREGS